jgi:UDP-glucose 4-epimerase
VRPSDRAISAGDSPAILRLTASRRSSSSVFPSAKTIDEYLALAYHNERGLPVVIGRLFNTVGPRQSGRYGMVIPNFVRQALAGEPITVHGDGSQRRRFCHVKGVVRAIADLMDNEAAVGEVFNIGSTEEVSMLELVERVKRACGSDSEIQLVPYEEAYESGFEDMRRRVPAPPRSRPCWAGGRRARLTRYLRT